MRSASSRLRVALTLTLVLLACGREADDSKNEAAAASHAPDATERPDPKGRSGPRFEHPEDAVGYALYRGRYEAYRRSASKLSADAAAVSSYRGESPIPGGRRIQVLASGNLRGTLEDCGCKNVPLGGLARRKTIASQIPEGDPVVLRLHLDAGDALFASKEPATAGSETAEQVTARAMLAAFAEMGVQALALGPHDLRFGAGWALREAERAGVAALACNLRQGNGWARGGALFGEGETRVGVVGVTLATSETAAALARAGVEEGAAVARYREEAASLSARGAAGIVLLASGGMDAARGFLEKLRDTGASLPVLTIVSGSLQLTGDPIWAAGVPVLEAGDQGKTLLRTDLFSTGARLAVEPEDGALLEGIRRYLTLLRSNENEALALLREQRDTVATKALLGSLSTRRREADAMARAFAAAARASGVRTEAGAVLRNRILPISPNTAEDADVKRLVDEAKRQSERLTRGRSTAKNGKAR